MGCIYCIQNLITDKRYIGQTKQRLSKRIYQHWMQAKKGVDTPLYHAIRKYSREDFEIFTLEECDILLLDEREQYWIEHFNTLKEGYNCDKGGQGILGFKHFTRDIFEQVYNRRHVCLIFKKCWVRLE